MKLEAFCEREKLSIGTLAEKLGVSHEAARLYVRGARIPRQDIMARIREVTGGEVSANDFFEDAPAASEPPPSSSAAKVA